MLPTRVPRLLLMENRPFNCFKQTKREPQQADVSGEAPAIRRSTMAERVGWLVKTANDPFSDHETLFTIDKLQN